MKTPREILLARHRAAAPRLDAIRRAALATMSAPDAAKPGWAGVLATLCLVPWRELILPSRRVWTGLAAVWVLLIAINFSQREPAASTQMRLAGPPSAMASWQVQQRWMNELLADRAAPPEIDRPRNPIPQPRTEWVRMATV